MDEKEVAGADGEEAITYRENISPDTNESISATPAEEAAIIRKLDYRLLPFVFVLYSLSVLDRSNIGNAKLAGLQKDVNLRGNHYNWLGTLFYIAYILFQWTTFGWKQFPAHIWGAIVVFMWGFIASVQAGVTGWGGLMALRFLLGISEAAFGPGVPLYLSYFYPRDKVGFRHGVFISGAAMANAYGSALAYGITQIHGTIAPWRILFLIEGLPTCALAVFAWSFLPDSIAKAPFLTEREKTIATNFVARNQKVDEGAAKIGVRPKQVLEAFKDPKSYLPAMMYFAVNVSFASLPLFLPTIIDEIGAFTTIQSQGLSAPPYLLAFILIITCSFLSDRLHSRSVFITGAAIVAGIGFVMLGAGTSASVRYAGTFLATQIFVCVSLLLSWTANLNASESRRAGGFVILSTIGQCGPILGTNVFPDSEKPYFRKGMWISCGMCFFVAVVSVTLSAIIRWEEKRGRRAGGDKDMGGNIDVVDTGGKGEKGRLAA